MDEQQIALIAIQKKLVGKKLTYEEVYAIMDEISHNRLGDILTTYFAASGYAKGFNNEELYFLTKAMVETGERLKFLGIVADKHSIGGVPGTRTSLIIIPIIAAAGFTIPKSSSRAITSPDGTADDMEVLAPVEFTKDEIYRIVKRTNGCIVWGGSFHIAPADDVLIQVERPLSFESYDKIVVSIMAKKIAFGSNHIIIDIPWGRTMKVHRREDAINMKDTFDYIAKKFGIKGRVYIHNVEEPAGRGIGPVLETKEALEVLEQTPNRPLDLEEKSLKIATELLELCLEDSKKRSTILKEFETPRKWAESLLVTGKALEKMKQIIKAQGGNPEITSHHLKPADYSFSYTAPKNTTVTAMNNFNITRVTRILGAPHQKKSGIFLHKKIGEKAEKLQPLYTLYSESMYNLREAKESIRNFPIMEIC